MGKGIWTDEINFKKYTCSDGQTKPMELNKSTSLYFVATRGCCEACEFCEFRGSGTEHFDEHLFEERLKQLLEVATVGTFHITGGEPSLRIKTVTKALKIVKKLSPLTFTSINTCGVYLGELLEIEELDNIALSRHHYLDAVNGNIFGGILSVPKENGLSKLDTKAKSKIHLSCNLIGGYIDNAEEIKRYLEFAGRLGIKDVGFVSLMPVNKYCKDHFVDFPENDLTGDKDIIKTRQQESKGKFNQTVCRCANYLYRTQNYDLISFYHRFAVKNKEQSDFLVYENNHMKQGFSGKTLI